VNGVVTPQSSIGVLNNQTSNVGDYVNLGYVNAGDILTFQMKVLDTGDIWNSNSASNTDGVNHIYSTSFSGDTVLGIPAGTYVGFEDIHGGGDFDYNDQAFIFTNISTLAEKHISPVPEPETYAMLLIGLGLVAFTVRSRKRRI
jgi:guanyl-specific ribonuclease Sa